MGFSAGQLANFSLAAQGAGAVTSAVGAWGQASTQRANLGAQAAVADANARIAELGAQAELHSAEQRTAAVTQQYGQLRSRQRASMAANGIALDEGSAADVMASTDAMREADKTTLEINAMRAAFGQRMQASNYQSQAAAARANASSISPGLAMGSSLLTGATRVASGWYQYSSNALSTANTVGANGGDALGAFINLRGW